MSAIFPASLQLSSGRTSDPHRSPHFSLGHGPAVHFCPWITSLHPWRKRSLNWERRLQDLYGDRFRGLLLFGSYARGDARERSDIDLLLLLDGPMNLSQELLRIQPVKWPLGLAADVLLSVFPVSYQAFQKAETSFLYTVR